MLKHYSKLKIATNIMYFDKPFKCILEDKDVKASLKKKSLKKKKKNLAKSIHLIKGKADGEGQDQFNLPPKVYISEIINLSVPESIIDTKITYGLHKISIIDISSQKQQPNDKTTYKPGFYRIVIIKDDDIDDNLFDLNPTFKVTIEEEDITFCPHLLSESGRYRLYFTAGNNMTIKDVFDRLLIKYDKINKKMFKELKFSSLNSFNDETEALSTTQPSVSAIGWYEKEEQRQNKILLTNVIYEIALKSEYEGDEAILNAVTELKIPDTTKIPKLGGPQEEEPTEQAKSPDAPEEEEVIVYADPEGA